MDVSHFYGHARHRSFSLGEGPHRALVLHGFPGTPGEVRPLAEWLGARGYRVTAPLLPGFGMGIGELGTVRWSDWVRAAAGAWSELQSGLRDGERQGGQTALLGFSMGGAVALQVAAATPAPPAQLVLIAPFWRMQDPRARWLGALRYAVPQLRPFEKTDFDDRAVRERFRRLEPTLDLGDPAVQRALRERVALPTAALLELQRLGRSAYRAAPRVSAPTLVVQGRGDATVAAADTRRLALRLGGPLKLLEVEGGHQLIAPYDLGFSVLCEQLEKHLEFSNAGSRSAER